jgi:uncharacterized protein
MHHKKLPWLRIALITAVTLVAGASLTRLTFDPSAHLAPPNDEFFRSLEQSSARFLSNDFIIVTVEHPDIFSTEALRLIDLVTSDVSALPEVSGALSLTTVARVTDGDSGFGLEQIIDDDAIAGGITPDDIQELTRFLDRYPFLGELTTTAGGNGAAIVAFPADAAEPTAFARAVFTVSDREGIPREHVFGGPVLQYYAARDNVHDATSLLLLALAVVFLVEWLVTRRLPLALVLWWGAVTPVVWTMALFIVFGIQLRIDTMVIPVTVLALATSYGIHIHRYHATHVEDGFRQNLRRATSIVLVAGITTLAGFASLVVSKLPTLQTIGLVSATGVGLSMVSALVYIAPIYELVTSRYPVCASLFERAKPRMSRIAAAVVVVTVAIVGIGAFRVYVTPRFATAFRPKSEASRAMAYFESNYFAGDTVELHLDTETEYGLVSLDTYGAIESIVGELKDLEGVAGVYSFTDIVTWYHGDSPDSEMMIGEALEMLSNSTDGLNIGAFVDVTYSAAKVIIRPEPSDEGHREFSATVEAIEAGIARVIDANDFSGTWMIGGSSPLTRRLNRYFAEGQISGVVLFIVAVFVVALVFLRNLRLAAFALLPPVCSALVYIGFVGWSGQPLNVAASVGFATVLGVSVDDIMYFLLYHRNAARDHASIPLSEAIRKAGPAIIETTVVLVFGVAVLLTSRYLNLAWTGAYIIAGLLTPTVVTLQVVPIIMGAVPRRTKEQLS